MTYLDRQHVWQWASPSGRIELQLGATRVGGHVLATSLETLRFDNFDTIEKFAEKQFSFLFPLFLQIASTYLKVGE